MRIETFSACDFANPNNSKDHTIADLVQKLENQIKTWLSKHPLYKEVERSTPSISVTPLPSNSLYVVIITNCIFEPS